MFLNSVDTFNPSVTREFPPNARIWRCANVDVNIYYSIPQAYSLLYTCWLLVQLYASGPLNPYYSFVHWTCLTKGLNSNRILFHAYIYVCMHVFVCALCHFISHIFMLFHFLKFFHIYLHVSAPFPLLQRAFITIYYQPLFLTMPFSHFLHFLFVIYISLKHTFYASRKFHSIFFFVNFFSCFSLHITWLIIKLKLPQRK